MTPIGRLRHRLKLEQPDDAPDGAGGIARSWQEQATLWGRLEPLSAEERVAAGRIEAVATHRITIRRRAGLSHEMRFALGNRRFAIRAIVGDERDRFIRCLCEETVP